MLILFLFSFLLLLFLPLLRLPFQSDHFAYAFHDERLLTTSTNHWYAEFSNYLGKDILPPHLDHEQRKDFFSKLKSYTWEDPFLYKECSDRVIRRCAMEHQMQAILEHCHTLHADGHHGIVRTASRVLQSGFYWPTLYEDARDYVNNCEECQRTGNLTGRTMKPLHLTQDIEAFDVWEASMIGPFDYSENRFILLIVDHVSEWAEILAIPDEDPILVTRFIRGRILKKWGTPRLMISDSSLRFCEREMNELLASYGSRHHVYPSQYSFSDGRDVEANHDLKMLLRITVEKTREDWPRKIFDTLWAYKTCYLTPMGASPFRLVFRYNCYLSSDIKQLSYWTMKTLNADCIKEWEPISLYFRESEAWRTGARAEDQFFEELQEHRRDMWIKQEVYIPGQEVLLYHTSLIVFPGVLSAGWSGPYKVTRFFYHGAVEIEKDGRILKVNATRVLPYSEESLDALQRHTKTRTFR